MDAVRIIQKIKSEIEDWVDFAENIWDILKDLWEELIDFLPWKKPREGEPLPYANIDGVPLFQYIPRTRLYSEITFEERLERLGLDIEQYREILNSFVGGSLHLKKKDPGAPYNKYPIVKTKFLDGYQPTK
jgi:hypothetical protein